MHDHDDNDELRWLRRGPEDAASNFLKCPSPEYLATAVPKLPIQEPQFFSFRPMSSS